MNQDTLPEALLAWQKARGGRQWDVVFMLRNRAEKLMEFSPQVYDVEEVNALRAAANLLEVACKELST